MEMSVTVGVRASFSSPTIRQCCWPVLPCAPCTTPLWNAVLNPKCSPVSIQFLNRFLQDSPFCLFGRDEHRTERRTPGRPDLRFAPDALQSREPVPERLK